MTNNKYTKGKVITDILSVFFITFITIVIPVWCHYDPKITDHGEPGKIPIQLALMMLDGIPFIFGVCWLSYRYLGLIADKYPFILTVKFRIIFVILGLSIVIFIKAMWS